MLEWSHICQSVCGAHVAADKMAGGGYQVNFSIYAGLTYAPQRMESLAGPWIDLGTVTLNEAAMAHCSTQICQQSLCSVGRSLIVGFIWQ